MYNKNSFNKNTSKYSNNKPKGNYSKTSTNKTTKVTISAGGRTTSFERSTGSFSKKPTPAPFSKQKSARGSKTPVKQGFKGAKKPIVKKVVKKPIKGTQIIENYYKVVMRDGNFLKFYIIKELKKDGKTLYWSPNLSSKESLPCRNDHLFTKSIFDNPSVLLVEPTTKEDFEKYFMFKVSSLVADVKLNNQKEVFIQNASISVLNLDNLKESFVL